MRTIITAILAAAIFVSGASVALAQQSLVGPPSWIVTRVAVAATATLVAPSRPTRLLVRVKVIATNQVTCGPANTVTAANGEPIPPTANSFIEIYTRGEVWCISAAGESVSVTESY